MSEEFLSRIVAPQLCVIATHWNRARGSRRMPAWSQLNPREIAPSLSLAWAYTYDREQDAFTGRLAGSQIEARGGKSFRGRNMTELFSGMELDWLLSICRRVVSEPALHCGSGMILSRSKNQGIGERIIMPLSQDGDVADGVLGATLYPDLGPVAALPLNFYQEERWFSLRGDGAAAGPA